MSKIKALLKANVKVTGHVDYVVSERFIDEETGKPLIFKLKPISAAEDTAMRNKHYSTDANTGITSFNSSAYSLELAAASIVEPNLGTAELQDDYGVKNAADLLGVMLKAGEFTRLGNEIQRINGFTEKKRVDEIKNS